MCFIGIEADPETGEVVEGRLRAAAEVTSVLPDGRIERPRIGFQDVGGMESLREEIRLKINHPVKHAELYQAHGKPIGGGIFALLTARLPSSSSRAWP